MYVREVSHQRSLQKYADIVFCGRSFYEFVYQEKAHMFYIE